MLALDTENETNKLGDVKRLKLISLMNEKIYLWANEKFSKPEITLGFSSFGFKFIGSKLLGYTNIMLRIDVALQVVTCNMFVAIKRKLTRVTCHGNTIRCSELTSVTRP